MRNETTIIREIKHIVNCHFEQYTNNVCTLVQGHQAACALLETHAFNIVDITPYTNLNGQFIIENLQHLDLKILDLILDIYQYPNFCVTKLPMFHLMYVDTNNKARGTNYSADIVNLGSFEKVKYFLKQSSSQFDVSDYNGIVDKEFNLDEFFYGGDIKKELYNFAVIYHIYEIDGDYCIRGKLIDNTEFEFKKILIT